MKIILIAITAALVLHTTAVHAVVFTSDASIVAGNTTYDGQDIVVSGCTLTVDGPHAFTSLLVTNNGGVTHTADPAGTTGNRLDLTIQQDATVDLGGAIQADGRGYGAGQGPGAGGADAKAWYAGGGAGHGGVGGMGDRGNGGTVGGGGAYGSVLEPTTKGSGGGWSGGAGGGVIRLTVGGTLTVNGQIRAAGNSASGYSGGGSGGSVWLTVGTLSGTGGISVNGGNGGSPYGGGGAGGRIAVYHTNNLFAGTLSAQAGTGYQTGGAGTIYTKNSPQAAGSVLVDNGGNVGTLTPLSTPAPFALTIAGQALVYPETNLTLRSLVVASNGTLFHLASQPGLDLTIQQDATVALGGAIQADGRGYAAGQGPGAGRTDSSNVRYAGGGAGHGGVGGLGDRGNGRTVGGGGAYGAVLEPTTKGSGGGWTGGAGGGVIRMTVGGTLTVEGQLSASGVSPTGDGGGGSGGGLWLTVGTLAGTGGIIADGGNGSSPYGGGGAGGRIAVYHTNYLFTGTLSAQGGTGYQTGGAGTIYTRTATQGVGEVLVYNLGTNSAMTPLTALEPFNLTIAGFATAFPETALLLGNLRLASGATLTHLLTQLNMDVTVLHDATIEPGGVIRADGLGNDPGPGAGGADAKAWYAGGGAGHGGVGGMGDRGNGGTVAGGIAYGWDQQPTDKGSRGGWAGGMGGGAIRLTVGGTLTVNGQISASGNSAIVDNAGGGSGGSIWLTSGILTGTGTISAIGGNGYALIGGGGAGGRVAIYATNTAGFGNDMDHIRLNAGGGYQYGGTGSLYFLSGYLPLQGIGFAPASTVMYAVSNIDVLFNVAVNPATVTTADDVTITTPAPGVTVPANQITVEMLGGTQLRLHFPPQNLPGTYQVQVGPKIEDLYGTAMAQAYGSTFVIAAPLISGTVRDTNGLPVTEATLQPSGDLGGNLTAINGQYSLPVLASWTGTVTPSKPGWMFVPGRRAYTNLTVYVTNQDYTLVETIASTLSIRQQGAECHVEWYGLNGVGYQPQSATNLVNWADYGSLRNGTNGPLWFNAPITSAPRMFFRIRSYN